MDPADEPVRRAGPADVPALADLLRRAWSAAEPTEPDPRRRAADVVERAETWVVGFEELRGVLVLEDDRVTELWVDPLVTGQGIEERLVALAELRRPDGVVLERPDQG